MAIAPIIHGNQNTTKLVNQLKTALKQYPLLSKAQEHDLIEKYKDDRETLNKLLFMHNIKMVFNIAKKYVSKTRDFDGLIQDGMEGLGIAAKRFDITKGVKFITYASAWIRKMILMNFYKRENKIESRSTSLDAPNIQYGKSGDNQDISFENYVNEQIEPTQDTKLSVHSEIAQNEQINICNQLYKILDNDSSLSSTEKAIFKDYFCNREKTRDIAIKYGVDVLQINQIRHTILSKFKDTLINQFQIYQYDDIMSR